jgi:hypothetical protein
MSILETTSKLFCEAIIPPEHHKPSGERYHHKLNIPSLDCRDFQKRAVENPWFFAGNGPCQMTYLISAVKG